MCCSAQNHSSVVEVANRYSGKSTRRTEKGLATRKGCIITDPTERSAFGKLLLYACLDLRIDAEVVASRSL